LTRADADRANQIDIVRDLLPALERGECKSLPRPVRIPFFRHFKRVTRSTL
jgi:hypothetical protein